MKIPLELQMRPCPTEPEKVSGTSIGRGLLARLKFGAEVLARVRAGETIDSALTNTQAECTEYAAELASVLLRL